MMQSAVCLLEQAAEKFKNKTVFEDKDGSISFEELGKVSPTFSVPGISISSIWLNNLYMNVDGA